MNNVNAKTNTDKKEIKYLTLDDLRKIRKEAETNYCEFLESSATIDKTRNVYINFDAKETMVYMKYNTSIPDDHAKFLLDFYNLFDEKEPYKDERSSYRDKLLNDLVHNIYEEDVVSPDGKDIRVFSKREIESLDNRRIEFSIGTINFLHDRTIKFLDNNQKIERLKKSFDIFKRLKERDLVLASMYKAVKDSKKKGPMAGKVEYEDYLGYKGANIILLNEKTLASYILDFFEKSNIDAFLFIRENFPNIKVTENMMPQRLVYKIYNER